MLDQKVKTFVEVALTGTYTQAAHNLNLTQPAVTKQIQQLEQEYGCQLINRATKPVSLTPAGDILLRASQTLIVDEAKLKHTLATHTTHATYHIGATLTVAQFLLPDCLSNCITQSPKDQFMLKVANTKTLCELLQQGTIDFALVEGAFDRTLFDWSYFSSEPFICIGSCHNKYTHAQKLEDLLDQTLILREQGSGTRTILESALKLKGLTTSQFARVLEIGDITTIIACVQKGIGISFLYQAAAEQALAQHMVQQIPTIGFPLFHDISFIWQRNSLRTPAIHSVIKRIQACNTANCQQMQS